MASETVIANMALSHLGVGKNIASLTEKSEEARSSNQFYTVARDMVLKAGKWPFATKIARLALVSINTTYPENEFGFTYRYPSDCLEARRVVSGIRQDSARTRVPYRIEHDSQGITVLTDIEDASLEYTKKVTNVALFPPDFMMAVSYLLASMIAPRVTFGDNFEKGKLMLQLYQAHMSNALVNAYNEEVPDRAAEAEWTQERGVTADYAPMTKVWNT